MVSYNQVSKLTYYSENNRKKEFLDLFISLCGSKNLLDVLSFVKYERFVEENSSIKLSYKEKEIVVFEENFLLNIPESSPTTHKIQDFDITVDFPNIIDYTCKPMHCIKSINFNDEIFEFKTNADFNLIPKTIYTELKPIINEYEEQLNNIFIYKVGDIQSRFFLDIELIIKIIYLAFVGSYKNIIEERLFLMKEYNFTYEAFDHLSFLEVKQHLTKAIKLVNERNNPETR
jgi:hypothetical protein|tara:strand:+ start:2854 stop:3546 length:693 start_codon:yes stop_codon:yes gene_type:complete